MNLKQWEAAQSMVPKATITSALWDDKGGFCIIGAMYEEVGCGPMSYTFGMLAFNRIKKEFGVMPDDVNPMVNVNNSYDTNEIRHEKLSELFDAWLGRDYPEVFEEATPIEAVVEIKEEVLIASRRCSLTHSSSQKLNCLRRRHPALERV